MTTQIHRISDKQPEFPCWLWAPKTTDERWEHFPEWLSAIKPALYGWTHWHPDQPEAPTATPPTEQATEGERDFGSNGGVKCDTDNGPCACGAWHDKKAVHALQWSDILDEVGALHCDENFDGNWKNGYEHFRADVLGVIDRLRHAPAPAVAHGEHEGDVAYWKAQRDAHFELSQALRQRLAAAESELASQKQRADQEELAAARYAKTIFDLRSELAELRKDLKTISELANDAPELNMKNYTENDVSMLNDFMTAIHKICALCNQQENRE